VPRYSRLVPVAEIADAKNDYNLNLPRYIDSTEPEDLQDIDGPPARRHPGARPRCAGRLLAVLPGVRAALFEPLRPGYARLKLPLPEVRPAILGHPEFAAFNQTVTKRFAGWREPASKQLTAFDKDGHPKALIEPSPRTCLPPSATRRCSTPTTCTST
jgi:type I restriction enzyme M protein